MRRTVWVCLLGVCLLLSGCGGEKNVLSPAIEFRAALVQADGCEFQAEITADFGESVEKFSLFCEAASDGATELTVTEPKTLAGITATVDAQTGTVTYDGMAMEFGLLANGNVIPAAMPSIVVRCWTSEYIASAGSEEELYRVTYQKDYAEKMLTVNTWYKNGIPISADVCYNETRILNMTITDFRIKD